MQPPRGHRRRRARRGGAGRRARRRPLGARRPVVARRPERPRTRRRSRGRRGWGGRHEPALPRHRRRHRREDRQGGRRLGRARRARDRARSDVRLVAHDPGGSGDGMLALGALGEAVWLADGMDASADALSLSRFPAPASWRERPRRRPTDRARWSADRTGTAAFRHLSGLTVIAPADHTAELRYSWFPAAAAAADPTGRRPSTASGPRSAIPSPPVRSTRPGCERPAATAHRALPRATCRPSSHRRSTCSAPTTSTTSSPPHMWRTGAPTCWSRSTSQARCGPAAAHPRAADRDGPARCHGVGRAAARRRPADALGVRHRTWTAIGTPRAARGRRARRRRPAEVDTAVSALTPTDTGTGLHDTILAAYRAAGRPPGTGRRPTRWSSPMAATKPTTRPSPPTSCGTSWRPPSTLVGR